jgi:hypothetical protein
MPSILDLSTELKLEIIEHLYNGVDKQGPSIFPSDTNDTLNLGRCCKAFRTLTAPFVYRHVQLRNNAKSGEAIRAVASGPYAEMVRELHFKCITALEDSEGFSGDQNAAHFEFSEEDFPNSVEEILSHLENFPNLETLSVQFMFGETDREDEEAFTSGFYTFDTENPYAEPGETEGDNKQAWKVVMAKAYAAISRNIGHKPKAFEMRNVVPSGVGTWDTEEFSDFLGSLEKFKISLCGGENGAGWCINTLPAYSKDAFLKL